MIFNSLGFLIFFPITVLMYYAIPHRFRYIWLLVCSYVFYLSQGSGFVVLLILSTIVTYTCGYLITKSDNQNIKKLIIALSLLINIGILIYFKYSAFFLSLIGSSSEVSLILPAGISFYTFQSSTYIFDCYSGKCKAEKNILKYALFVSFFPCILSGPIERASNLLPQFDEEHSFDCLSIKEGLFMMLWGYFLKMVIVSRLAILTDLVYGNYSSYAGASILIAAIAYMFRIYCDFAGYSFIAIGAAKIMGFNIINNFNRPYLAVSVQDFWRRWHISLSTWFRDYLYIPLGGSRVSKIRKYINIIIVFLVSGLWHGANLTFVIWGLAYGIYQVIGDIIKPVKKALKGLSDKVLYNKCFSLLEIGVTNIIVCLTWIIFAAPSLNDASGIYKNLFTNFRLSDLFSRTIFSLGLGMNNLAFVIAALIILIASDIICEKRKCTIEHMLDNTHLIIRWTIYYILILMIMLSCNLSTQEFLYQQF